MTKIIWLFLVLNCSLVASAQTADELPSVPAAAPMTPAAERARIMAERAGLEAGFNLDSAACYKKFLTSSCLDDIRLRRRDALADLRRQEIALNAADRRAKAAGQVKKTEEKSSPENRQQDADKRAAVVKDFQIRLDREKQKNEARAGIQSNEPDNSEVLAERIRSQQARAAARTSRQAGAAEKLKKFNERQEKARERQAQRDRDLLNQTRPAQPLPVPP